jgi:hypothetical protein
MRLINVIVIKDNLLDSIETFPVIDDQLSSEVVEQAENYFIEQCKLNEPNLDSFNFESFIEDKYFSKENISICLTWSNISI